MPRRIVMTEDTPMSAIDVSGHEGQEEALARIVERLQSWQQTLENEGDLSIVMAHITRRGGVGNNIYSGVFTMSDHIEPYAQSLLSEAIGFGENLRAGRTSFKLFVEDKPKLGCASFTITFANEGDQIAQDLANGPVGPMDLLTASHRHTEVFLRTLTQVWQDRYEDMREAVREANRARDKLMETQFSNLELFGELQDNVWQRRRADKLDQMKEKGLEMAGSALMSLAMTYASAKSPELVPAVKAILGAGMGGEPEPVPQPQPQPPTGGVSAPAPVPAPVTSPEEPLEVSLAKLSDEDLIRQAHELETSLPRIIEALKNEISKRRTRG